MEECLARKRKQLQSFISAHQFTLNSNMDSMMDRQYKKKCLHRSIRRACLFVIGASGLITAWLHMGIIMFGRRTTTTNNSVRMASSTNAVFQTLRHSLRISKKSPLVAQDEFFYHFASDQEVEDYFRFDFTSWEDLERRYLRDKILEPIWKCSDFQNRSSSSRIVFMQVFRSGGATIRALLKAYATVCQAGFAVVSQCHDLSYPILMDHNETWINGGAQSPHYMSECQLSSLQERNGTIHTLDLNESNPISNHILEERHIDILAGYVPLQSANGWRNPVTKQPVDARYVIILRDPLVRFVSQFIMPRWTFNDSISITLSNIESRVKKNLALSKYPGKLSYLMVTPEQRYWAERESVRWTMERQVNISKANLIRYNVVVTTLEDLRNGVHLIRRLVDQEDKLSKPFELFSLPQSQRAGNASGQRTLNVVQAIRTNPELTALMEEYLKYELDFYNFGVKISQLQTKIIRGKEDSKGATATS